ncbi:unnamed protein product [Arabidopsis lyrata]|nr:unnamed protein product [Arabidopsis lyrata]
MNDPCRLNLLCNCSRNLSQTIDTIKNIIETCIQKYMSLEETVTYLQDNHKISHHLTKPIWEQLQKESPEFFNKYHLKRELACHITMYNSLLRKQVSLMVEYGALDINTATSAVKNFLRQDPEGAHLLEKLADTPSDRLEVSCSSVAMLVLDDTNGPIVNQWQIPNDQQNQFHHYQWSTTTNHLPLNRLLIPNDQQNNFHQNQWSTPNNHACTNLGAPTVPILELLPMHQQLMINDYDPVYSAVAPTVTAQCPTSNDLAYSETPTVAKAPTAAFDHFTDGFGDDIKNSVPNFQPMDPSTTELLTQIEHLLDDQYGEYELPLELQPNFSLNEL